MKTRIITGAAYVAVLVGFYVLKIVVHDLCFDVLLYAFALIGTFELLRAVKEKTTKSQRSLAYGFAALALPVCALAEQFFRLGILAVAALFFLFSVMALSLLVVKYSETTLENVGYTLFAMVYPNLLLCLLCLMNHIPGMAVLQNEAFDSNLLVLFIFVVSPIADSFAYFFGVLLKKKFPTKFCESISPNKTRIGAIGGLVGGVVAAGLIYAIYNATVGNFVGVGLWLPVYLCMGLIGAVATEFGDLLESAIKRKIGIKDMGNLMPGHGGVLDRIDGTMFATVAVTVVYAVLLLIFV